MKKNTIPTLHRTLASVLLISQLLTSCGGAEMIAPASTTSQTQQHMGLSDANPIPASSMGSPVPLAVPDSQGYAPDASEHSFNSLSTYTTRQGHKIAFVHDGGKYVARVQEQLPPGFSSGPYTLPVYFQQGLFPEYLTPDSYVDVVFPRQANGNKGYVFCAEYGGLLGGGEGGSKRGSDGCAYRANERVWNSSRGCYTCPGRGQHPRSSREDRREERRRERASDMDGFGDACYDPDGDYDGFDEDGFDEDGSDEDGFDEELDSGDTDDAAEIMKDNQKVALEAVKNFGSNLSDVSSRLQDNKEVVLSAVRNHGSSLCWASSRLQDDREVVLAAINENVEALNYARSCTSSNK